MMYRTLKSIRSPNAKTNQRKDDVPIEKARGYNDIRFYVMFFDGSWLMKGPKREIKVILPLYGNKDDYLWPVKAVIRYDRKIGAYTWLDISEGKTYRILFDGKLGDRVIP